MPAQIKCSHILVKTEKEAKDAEARLKKGDSAQRHSLNTVGISAKRSSAADFSKIAQEISMCPSGKRGGDLGFFGRGAMVREFEKAAFGLEKGQVSPPVKTEFGWHLIKRTE